MKDSTRIEWLSTGFLLATLLIAFIVFIIQLAMPTKRQAYKVTRENNLTIVERVDE